MKLWKSTNFFSLIAIIAAMLFTVTACDNNGGDEGGDIDLPGTITISPSGSVTVGTALTATYSGTVAVAYQWKRDSTNVGSNSIRYTPDQMGSYTVTVSAHGYYSKTSDTITVIAANDAGDNDDTGGSDSGNGSGSVADPFQVDSVAALQKVGTGTDGWTLSAHYQQTAHINLATVANWTPIGSWSFWSQSITFTGTYDGGGYTISNLRITAINDEYQGLFGYVETGGVVKNVGIINCTITSSTDFYGAGGVVGLNSGTVTNCYVTGDISSGLSVGGLVGSNYGTVEYSYATGTISGGGYVGGVVGSNYGTVKNNYATGNVSGSGIAIGGVVGHSDRGTVTNCYATGNVSGNNYRVGGVIGSNYSSSTVEKCYATGDVSGDSYVGGVVGLNSGTVRNCVALNRTITKVFDIGSVLGRVGNNGVGGSLSNNYARSDMEFRGITVTVTSDASGRHGVDITSADWGSSNWWSTASTWDTRIGIGLDLNTIWEWDSMRNLPKLRNVGAQ